MSEQREPVIVRGAVVATERAELGVGREVIATLVGTHAVTIRTYEEGVLKPSIALQREVQHALYFLRLLKDGEAPFDLNNPAELLPAWAQYNAARLPQERAQFEAEKARGEAVS